MKSPRRAWLRLPSWLSFPWRRTDVETEQYRLLMDGIADYALLLLDAHGCISTWTMPAEKIFGYRSDEIQGRHFSVLYPPNDFEARKPHQELTMAAAHGRIEDTSWRLRKDGSQFWAESVICPLRKADGEIRGYSLIIRDITERKKSSDTLREKEEELAHARKMEAIGRLAGGVAHDFNNFITGIMGMSEEIHQSLDPSDSRRGDLEQIMKVADRARLLTRELLAFGRKQVSSPEVLNLNSYIEDRRRILMRLLGADIVLELRLEPSIGNVLLDPTQLDQVLVNLVINARDAMPKGGRITVSTGRVFREKDNDGEMRPGPYVALKVSDTGIGMNDDVLAHLFEPFFTTKQQGQGTGLGLATVYGIVKQNFGQIRVESQPKKGSTFEVLLPEVDAPVKIEEPDLAPARVTGTETVLLVEDEEIVRTVVRRTLERCGYRVLWAPSGERALDVGIRYQEPIHLLLTDVVMPEMNGRALAERFRTLHPETRVLYMSAYSEDVIHQRGILEKGISFLEKPFTKEVLIRKVGEVLENDHAATATP